jgi:hypothetical protein
VRFAAELPSKWVAHCHCTICRRAHGAGCVTWAGFPSSAVRIEDTEARLCWFESSKGAQRGFCGRCGSPLFFRSKRWPDELHVARAQFDTPLDRAPSAHVFWDSHVEWMLPNPSDGLPRKPEV